MTSNTPSSLRLGLALAVALTASACPAPTPMCTPGAKDCACKEQRACDDGLVCGGDDKCAAPTTLSIQASDPAARGCEAVLTEASGTVLANVSFKNGVVGTFLKEAPRSAVTFVAPGDAAFPTGGVEVTLTGPTAGIAISKASCVDAAGQKLASVTLSLR